MDKTRMLEICGRRLWTKIGLLDLETRGTLSAETANRPPNQCKSRRFSNNIDILHGDRTGWLPFLDAYRTMCLGPEPASRQILEDVREFRFAAQVQGSGGVGKVGARWLGAASFLGEAA